MDNQQNSLLDGCSTSVGHNERLSAVQSDAVCGEQSSGHVSGLRRWGVTAVCLTLLTGSGFLLKPASGAKDSRELMAPEEFVEASCSLEGTPCEPDPHTEVVIAAALPRVTSMVDEESGDEESGDEESGDEEQGKRREKASGREKPAPKDPKEKSASKPRVTNKEEEDGEKPAPPRKSNLPSPNRRLPAGYNALELTDEQKEQIFAIQDAKQKKLDSLENALSEFRAAMELEFEEVLTSSQKKQLAENRGMSRKNESVEKSTGSAKSKS